MNLHNHPQKKAYADDGSDWPKWSAQAHWLHPPGTLMPIPGLPDYMQNTSHTHVDWKFPRYAETAGAPFQVAFTVKLFHTPGHITRIDSILVRDIIWDETGTATPPTMVGDPMGIKQWTGHLTVDPKLPIDPIHTPPPRGWFGVQFGVQTTFDSGDNTETIILGSIYSLFDPAAPETWNYIMTRAAANAGSILQTPVTQWGINFVHYVDYLPVAPISAPWPIRVGAVSYGGSTTLPHGTFEQRADLDLHNGKPGLLLATQPVTADGIDLPIVFDPAQLGPGVHTMAGIMNQPDRVQQLTVLLVIDVEVDPNAPPPVQPASVAVPNVVGQTQANAQMLLAAAGFVVRVGSTATSLLIPSGSVVSQAPLSSALASMGSPVTLVISTGPPMPPPVPTQQWRPSTPSFMQLFTNGVAQDRWQICDPNEAMTPGTNCPEIVTIPAPPAKVM